MSGNGRGIALMCLTMFVLAVQDGFSRYLAAQYDVTMVVMLRYWFFAVLAVAIAWRRGVLRHAWATPRPGLQFARAAILALEIVVLVWAFVALGLTESHAIFALCPLLVAALSVPLLGERVGPARWAAIGVGLAGVLVILMPDGGVFSPLALVPLGAAFLFALYAVLTRLASRTDTALTSFVWTGVVGAVLLAPFGLAAWEPMTPADWGWMAGLCIIAAAAQWLFILTYEAAEASAVQPFAYLQLVFAAAIGVTIFDEVLRPNVAVGASIVIAAGLFALWRARQATAAR